MSPARASSCLLAIVSALAIHASLAQANSCDVDRDGDVDVVDLAATRHAAQARLWSPADARHVGGDEPIRQRDASSCERLCTRPDCAAAPANTPPENAPPVASDDQARTTEAVPASVDVLANDTDPDGDPVHVEFAGAATKATTSVASDGRVTYAPTAGYVGYDEFEYRISDPAAATATAMVAMLIEPVDAGLSRISVRPVEAMVTEGHDGTHLAMFEIELVRGSNAGAVTVEFTTVDDTATEFSDYLPVSSSVSWAEGDSAARLIGVEIAGDSLVETAEEFVVALRHPVNAVIDGAQARLRIRDDDGAPDNDAPLAVNDTAAVLPESATDIPSLANDVDPDGDALAIVGVGQPFHGSATITGSAVTYTPRPGFLGRDYFRYRIADSQGQTDEGLISVTVAEAANALPVAVDDTATATGGQPVVVPVLDNDTDADGDPIEIVAVSQPAHGSATFSTTSVTYAPDAGYSGSDSFTYTIGDGRGGEASATVSVTVESATLPRVELAFDTVAVVEGGPGSVSTAVVAVTLVAPQGSDQWVEALIVTEDGSASAFMDYDPVFLSLVWGPGETGPRYLLVSIYGDAVAEGDEAFDVAIAEVTNAVAGSPSRMTVQIVDDD